MWDGQMEPGRRRDELNISTAKSQLGLFNIPQYLAAGHTKDSIHRLHKRGRLERYLPGVYRYRGLPRSWEADAMAAHLYLGADSALSFQSAAFQHGLPRFGPTYPIHLSVPGRGPGRVPPGIKVHQGGGCLPAQLVTIKGLPVTSPPRTVFDLAAANDKRMESALDEFLRRGATNLEQAWALAESAAYAERRGWNRYMDALAERSPADSKRDSDLERVLAGILSAGGATPFVIQHPVVLKTGILVHLDVAFPEVWLDIESDGYATHGGREPWERDHDRDMELTDLGWLVMRFTWRQITFRPERVLAAVMKQLTDRGFWELVVRI